MPEQFLTCKFKIHNPSRHKRNVLEHAMREYTLAYSELLDYALENKKFIMENGKYLNPHTGKERYTGKSIARFLPRIESSLHSSAQDSLIQDVSGNLASYFALLETDPRTSFPTCRDPDPEAIANALSDFVLVGSDQDDFDKSIARLLTVSRGTVMPLYFARPDAASQTRSGASRNRNFSLLWNTKKRQLMAVMYLLPMGHEMCKPVGVNQDNLVRLDTGEIFKTNSKSAILVPLEMGRNNWQEFKFLQPAMNNQARIKSAFLVLDRTGDYFLHVSFAFYCPAKYAPQAYLGIDKGILITAAYAVVDKNGGVIEMDHIDDKLRCLQIKHGEERERLARNGKKITYIHYRRRAYDNILYNLANTMIEMALEYQAQIVLEDLNVQVRGGRVISRFRKLDNILGYKCNLVGIPIRSVFAAYSSEICHKCGGIMNRDDRLVICPHCGYEGHSDDNAAVNIARRALYRKKDWEKRGGYKAFHRSFANDSTL